MTSKATGVRKYGKPPYTVVVLHGGPGAPGYMAPVARELQADFGVLEPLQSRDSLEGQIIELGEQLGDLTPIDLVGSSWGAILALFFAAKHQDRIRKLILIGSAVFDIESSDRCKATRSERLSEAAKIEMQSLVEQSIGASNEERNQILRKVAALYFDADMFDPITRDDETIEAQFAINQRVWNDFKILRDRDLIKPELSKITTPTAIIHGDYDPHPIEGIVPFLKSCLPDVSVHLIKNCGHLPWLERQAKDQFFTILKSELNSHTPNKRYAPSSPPSSRQGLDTFQILNGRVISAKKVRKNIGTSDISSESRQVWEVQLDLQSSDLFVAQTGVRLGPTPLAEQISVVFIPDTENINVGDLFVGITRSKIEIRQGWAPAGFLKEYKLLKPNIS